MVLASVDGGFLCLNAKGWLTNKDVRALSPEARMELLMEVMKAGRKGSVVLTQDLKIEFRQRCLGRFAHGYCD